MAHAKRIFSCKGTRPKMSPKYDLHPTKKFVYLRSTYVISVQFIGTKHASAKRRNSL